MAKEPELPKGKRKPVKPDPKAPAPDTYEALQDATSRQGLFGRVNQRFQDVLQTSRGPNRRVEPRTEGEGDPYVSADDLAIRRARNVSLQRMIIPEGVIIDGSMTSGSETEIAGRVDGDVTVDGNLNLGATSLISGNVRAATCQVEGLVEGRMECSEDLMLGQNGRLNADCMAGKRLTIAGQVFGNVSCSGILRLESSAQVTGNIRARTIVIEEGAMFNGGCAMRAPSQRSEK